MPPVSVHFERFVKAHLAREQQRYLLRARLVEQRNHFRRPLVACAQRFLEHFIHAIHHATVIQPAVTVNVQALRAIRDERADSFRRRHDAVNVAVDVTTEIQPRCK